MTARVTADGQLALPAEVRARLGLVPGQTLEIRTEGEMLVAWRKFDSDDDVFEKWRGRGRTPGGAPVDKYLGLIRDGDGR